MEAYERIMCVLEGKKEEIDRLPCMNSASMATKELMEKTGAFWPEAHKDPEKMAKLGSAAHRFCGMDNISIPFDMTVEAEVFGAPIDFRERAAKKGRMLWPIAKSFLIDNPAYFTVPKGFPMVKRIPVIVEAIKILKKEFEGKVPVNVIMVPPFTSLSSYLVDTVKFMMWTRSEPDKIREFMNVSIDPFIEIAKTYEEAGADIITLHEMGGSMDNVSPASWKEFIMPYLKKLIGSLKCKVILNICGRASGLVEMMVECGPDAIAVDERTPIPEARKKIDSVKKGFPLMGNVPSKSVIHDGTVEKIRQWVEKVIKDGVDIVAPGCDFWIETPIDKIKAFVDAANELGKRQ
ncbi:MAG: uroporphyrinogen decarboxylase family protein [Candidatus Methanospirareceae archaeon]